ncbi:hypothetical protein Nepgr_022563 [Nepenthes gracilis]|uniref:Uncharacterized protein n=1 Tax=Nepenthes gracilis TaxID=150966 RepID=A0AAD3T2T5_NEPGR|nr:hypothetical protein Nepgr_022563 [Nepenthes gracilis]
MFCQADSIECTRTLEKFVLEKDNVQSWTRQLLSVMPKDIDGLGYICQQRLVDGTHQHLGLKENPRTFVSDELSQEVLRHFGQTAGLRKVSSEFLLSAAFSDIC